MKWVDEAPTQAGYYWHEDLWDNRHGNTYPVEITKTSRGMVARRLQAPDWPQKPVAEMIGQWEGPFDSEKDALAAHREGYWKS